MKRIFLFLALSLVLPSWAQVYTAKSGEVSFHSEAPLENIDAVNHAPNSVLNTETREIAFLVPIRKFIFKKSLMQEHFNEKYMESDKYPSASFKGRINEAVNFSSDGESKVTATGKMTIHGVEREVTVPGTVTVKNGEISIQAAFTVKVKDYNITIPKLMFQNIAESIDVKVNIHYTPYKK
jgi:polyisoprenoid-binding protein YceI